MEEMLSKLEFNHTEPGDVGDRGLLNKIDREEYLKAGRARILMKYWKMIKKYTSLHAHYFKALS